MTLHSTNMLFNKYKVCAKQHQKQTSHSHVPFHTQVKGKVAFHRATVLILETGETTVSTLQQPFSLQTAIHILPDELILLYGAMVDCEGDMVHTGDFVEVRTSENVVSTSLVHVQIHKYTYVHINLIVYVHHHICETSYFTGPVWRTTLVL